MRTLLERLSAEQIEMIESDRVNYPHRAKAIDKALEKEVISNLTVYEADLITNSLKVDLGTIYNVFNN